MRGTPGPSGPTMLDDAAAGRVWHRRLGSSIPIPNVDLKQFAPVAWAWFHQHTGETVYTIKAFGFFSYKIVWGDPATTYVMNRLFGSDSTV